MAPRNWLITGVSSGFGRELATQLLDRGDPARMAAAIIASADQEPAPLRIILGSQALQTTVGVLKDRLASFEAQASLAASTDFPPGK
jgi:NAD(P)-dependent dehydrogenase (short-subunit alcohol dehydrogenase family)